MSDGLAAARRGRPASSSFPYLTGLSAQRVVELVALRIAPAVAGARDRLHATSTPSGRALLVFVSHARRSAMLLRSPHYPLHLIPFASAILYLLAAPLGAAARRSRSAPRRLRGQRRHRPASMVAAGARRLGRDRRSGAWLNHRFRREREVRIAVIGSHEFTRGPRGRARAPSASAATAWSAASTPSSPARTTSSPASAASARCRSCARRSSTTGSSCWCWAR